MMKAGKDHSHCLYCLSSVCTISDDCPIVSCPDCGITLHQCKLVDHSSYICREKIVQCSNVIYGCTEEMKRQHLKVHLEHCPASVVQCRFVYQRWQMEHYHLLFGSESDVMSSDEKFLKDDLFFIQKQRQIKSENVESTEMEFLPNKVNLQCIVDHEYYIRVQKQYHIERRSYERKVLLSLNYYQFNTHRKNGLIPCHAFICGEYVRRDQFNSHMANHLQLMIDLPLIIARCPLHFNGCMFRSIVYQPSPKGHCLDFNSYLSSFRIIASKNDEMKRSVDYDVFRLLPVEVLLRILSCLDSLSLWSVSQVSHYLRNISQEFLVTKGIVYYRWEKGKTSTSKWNRGVMVSNYELFF